MLKVIAIAVLVNQFLLLGLKKTCEIMHMCVERLRALAEPDLGWHIEKNIDIHFFEMIVSEKTAA